MNDHPERSESAADGIRGTDEEQIPRGLTFTPSSAKPALDGDPAKPARDDNQRGADGGTAEAVPFQNEDGMEFTAKAVLHPAAAPHYVANVGFVITQLF
jgi:hypothetical protein